MNWIKVVLFIFITILVSCTNRAPHVSAGDHFIEKFSKHVKRTQGLRMYGCGGGFQNDINTLSFYFYSSEILDINEARRYLIENAELLLSWINSSEELDPYLHEHPYTYKGVKLCFAFTNACTPDSKMISMVNLEKGLVGYYIYDPILDRSKALHLETYKKACGLLEHQKSIDNLASFPDDCFQYQH